MEYIVWLDEMIPEAGPLLGGKGQHLTELVSIGMPVPEGFVINTKAFDSFLELNRIKEKIQQMIDSCDVEDTQKLLDTSKRIKELILSGEYPLPIKSEITQAYNEISVSRDIKIPKLLDIISPGRDYAIIAVRSSATTEDLPSIGENEPVIAKINDGITYTEMKNLWKIYQKMKTDGNKILVQVPSLEKTSKVKWVPVSEIYRHYVKNVTLAEILTRTGRNILVTPDHSLIALDAEKLEPRVISVDDIAKSTRIPVIKHLPRTKTKRKKFLEVSRVLNFLSLSIKEDGIRIKDVKNWKISNSFPLRIKIDENFAYFLGIYEAEGSTYKNNCVDVSCQSTTIARKVKKYLSSLGLKCGKDKKNVRVFNKVLVALLHELVGKPLSVKGKGKLARVKRVPNIIFNQNEKIIAAFLKGCFDGDGYVSKESMGLISVSKNLTGGVTKLLEMLDIRFYFSKENTISIFKGDLSKFYKIVGLTEKKNRERLKKIIKIYEQNKKHFDFLDNLPPSTKLAEIIRKDLETKLPLQDTEVTICPRCSNRMIKFGRSESERQKYFCKNCKGYFTEGSVKLRKTVISDYVNYDEKGRFKKGSIPWNKGRLSSTTYGISYLKKIAKRYGAKSLREIINSDVIWDKIKEIKFVNYSGYVYDFVVPNTQNFAAGLGGIITHNTASFAGQMASFLNIKGVTGLLDSVKRCWASLYEPRAIFYRAKHGFKHASIAVIVQRMVNADKAGVLFTINPSTNENVIIIEACWGLGESLVLGEVQPDSYTISKDGKILEKKIGRKEIMRVRDLASDKTIELDVIKEKREQQVLTDEEILRLAEYAKSIENHYRNPQDIEFAIEREKIYIVQTRAVTTKAKVEEIRITKKSILKGLGVSPGIATGIVRIVHGLEDITKVQKGDILVTTMTSPDLVPTMSKCSAIITDSGGQTCHAAIVSREMSIPAVVGTQTATKSLEDGQLITVDAHHGLIYSGKVEVGKPVEAVPRKILKTKTAVKVNVAFPQVPESIAKISDGVGLLRIEHMIINSGFHPAKLIKEGRREDYIQILLDGIRPIAKAFYPKPVWVRTLDARSDEFRNLKGGEEEIREDNPMLGWHGIRRSLDEPELLKAEFEAIRRLYEEGLDNLHVMLPFVISVEEFKKVREIANKILPETCKLGIMVEVPSCALTIEDFCKEGIDFASIGSNDLTMMTLGVDRNNAKISNLYSETHPAVLKLIEHTIKTCNKYNIESSICGELPSNRPEIAEFLIKCGITSISVNIDALQKVKEIVSSIERELTKTKQKS